MGMENNAGLQNGQPSGGEVEKGVKQSEGIALAMLGAASAPDAPQIPAYIVNALWALAEILGRVKAVLNNGHADSDGDKGGGNTG